MLGHSAPSIAGGGYNWRRLVADIAEQKRVTVKGLAALLADELAEPPETVRKGLQRLQTGKSGAAGKYGTLLLNRFPVVAQAEAIGRHIGQYHGPAADLPAEIRAAWIAVYDSPPSSQTAAGDWLMVARAGLAIWRQDFQAASGELAKVKLQRASTELRLEVLSVSAFVESRSNRRSEVTRTLAQFSQFLDEHRAELPPAAAACYFARWVDQQAYELYKPQPPQVPDLHAALGLYSQIPKGGPVFSQVRRELGLSLVWLKMAQADTALLHARNAVDIAGDGALVRLRAQALRQQARCLEELGDRHTAQQLRARALAIADRLGDDNLAARLGGQFGRLACGDQAATFGDAAGGESPLQAAPNAASDAVAPRFASLARG